MKKELEYFYIGDSYGGNQEFFSGMMMKMGGCAAETICDACVYFAKYFGETVLYPYSLDPVKKEDYVALGETVRQYVWPRAGGVSKLSIYIDGIHKFFEDIGETKLTAAPFSGDDPVDEAETVIRRQIDRGYPVPNLTLRHKDKSMDDYIWHWYMLNGYDLDPETGRMSVRAVTYSEWKWLDFATLWNTGNSEKGGFIIFDGLGTL